MIRTESSAMVALFTTIATPSLHIAQYIIGTNLVKEWIRANRTLKKKTPFQVPLLLPNHTALMPFHLYFLLPAPSSLSPQELNALRSF